MSRNTSLEALKGHLFETLEGVKNLSDPIASENEKTTIEQAKTISDVAGKIIDVYKVQLDGVRLAAKLDDVADARSIVTDLGVINDNGIKLLQ